MATSLRESSLPLCAKLHMPRTGRRGPLSSRCSVRASSRKGASGTVRRPALDFG
jgi:hypothetical protein